MLTINDVIEFINKARDVWAFRVSYNAEEIAFTLDDKTYLNIGLSAKQDKCLIDSEISTVYIDVTPKEKLELLKVILESKYIAEERLSAWIKNFNNEK